MKRIVTIAALSLLTVAGSRAALAQQAYLGIFAETSNMRMAGMAMPKLPDLPPGIKLPPQALAAIRSLGGPQRKLTVRLWSPGIAAQDAKATLAVPDGLKQGPKLDLDLFAPPPSLAPPAMRAVVRQARSMRAWSSSSTGAHPRPSSPASPL